MFKFNDLENRMFSTTKNVFFFRFVLEEIVRLVQHSTGIRYKEKPIVFLPWCFESYTTAQQIFKELEI